MFHHQFDLKTLGDRRADVVFIDEIDNYILDCCNDQARVATPTPNGDTYSKIYYMIWHLVYATDRCIYTHKGQLYYFENKINQDE